MERDILMPTVKAKNSKTLPNEMILHLETFANISFGSGQILPAPIYYNVNTIPLFENATTLYMYPASPYKRFPSFVIDARLFRVDKRLINRTQ